MSVGRRLHPEGDRVFVLEHAGSRRTGVGDPRGYISIVVVVSSVEAFIGSSSDVCCGECAVVERGGGSMNARVIVRGWRGHNNFWSVLL